MFDRECLYQRVVFSQEVWYRWNSIPMTTEGLKRAYDSLIISFDTPMHVHSLFSFDSEYPQGGTMVWEECSVSNSIVQIVWTVYACWFSYCRYAVIRRSATNPIFHPYYINYGYNKVSLISRLIYDGMNSFFLLSQISPFMWFRMHLVWIFHMLRRVHSV